MTQEDIDYNYTQWQDESNRDDNVKLRNVELYKKFSTNDSNSSCLSVSHEKKKHSTFVLRKYMNVVTRHQTMYTSKQAIIFEKTRLICAAKLLKVKTDNFPPPSHPTPLPLSIMYLWQSLCTCTSLHHRIHAFSTRESWVLLNRTTCLKPVDWQPGQTVTAKAMQKMQKQWGRN